VYLQRSGAGPRHGGAGGSPRTWAQRLAGSSRSVPR
jgi:hypothetical protein